MNIDAYIDPIYDTDRYSVQINDYESHQVTILDETFTSEQQAYHAATNYLNRGKAAVGCQLVFKTIPASLQS